MATLQRWEPFRGLVNLHEDLERLFGKWTQPQGDETTRADWVPPVDISEDENGVRLAVELPGLSRDDIQVTVEDHCLTISGERKFEHPAPRENMHRVERSYGKFARTFRLPPTIDAEKVSAEMNNGLMLIALPKKPEAKSKRVEVKVH